MMFSRVPVDNAPCDERRPAPVIQRAHAVRPVLHRSAMDSAPHSALIVSRSDTTIRVISDLLRGGFSDITLIDLARSTPDVLERLASGGVEVVLLDVSSTSDMAAEVVHRARDQAPDVPIVLVMQEAGSSVIPGLGGTSGDAQDTVVLDQLGAAMLPRVLRYAIERQRLQNTLRQLSLTDELTGLYNRTGFLALCEHHLTLAPRTRGLMIALVDVKGLRAFNDRSGWQAGNQRLRTTADILRATFRASDVIARLGADDFAVLVLDAGEDAGVVVQRRLEAQLALHATRAATGANGLELAMTLTRIEPGPPLAIDDLLERSVPGLRGRR
ncbi:MAG: GGDEF domain-containing protein [Gemmatimonadaceae bacterium]